MFKKLWNFNFLYMILLAFCAVQTVLLFFLSKNFFYISLALLYVAATALITALRKPLSSNAITP